MSKAETVVPPVQAENLWVFAGSDYAAVSYIAVPEGWKGSYLTFTADGDDWYIVFSTSASGNGSTTKTAKSTVASNAVTALGANCMAKIANGTSRDFDMATVDFHKVKTLILIANARAGQLRVENSSRPVA